MRVLDTVAMFDLLSRAFGEAKEVPPQVVVLAIYARAALGETCPRQEYLQLHDEIIFPTHTGEEDEGVLREDKPHLAQEVFTEWEEASRPAPRGRGMFFGLVSSLLQGEVYMSSNPRLLLCCVFTHKTEESMLDTVEAVRLSAEEDEDEEADEEADDLYGEADVDGEEEYYFVCDGADSDEVSPGEHEVIIYSMMTNDYQAHIGMETLYHEAGKLHTWAEDLTARLKGVYFTITVLATYG